jgi:hypothetical protein
MYKRAHKVSVFGDSCQRGREYYPKAKEPHHHLIFNCVLKIFIGISIFQIGIPLMRVSQLIYPKTLLKAKRRISIRGSFV